MQAIAPLNALQKCAPFELLCQQKAVASTMARIDFDADALPFVPAFRQARSVEEDSGVAYVDAKPTALALGVYYVA